MFGEHFLESKIRIYLSNLNEKLQLFCLNVYRNGQISMDMLFSNKAMQPMGGFAIQLNKNSFGLTPAAPLQIAGPLNPGASIETSVILSTTGAVQRMDPLNDLQVAMKNNIGIFYFACLVPMNVYFTEDGQLDKRIFLSTWKDIPAQNEVQSHRSVPNLIRD